VATALTLRSVGCERFDPTQKKNDRRQWGGAVGAPTPHRTTRTTHHAVPTTSCVGNGQGVRLQPNERANAELASQKPPDLPHALTERQGLWQASESKDDHQQRRDDRTWTSGGRQRQSNAKPSREPKRRGGWNEIEKRARENDPPRRQATKGLTECRAFATKGQR
jgi:hypothetical protein